MRLGALQLRDQGGLRGAGFPELGVHLLQSLFKLKTLHLRASIDPYSSASSYRRQGVAHNPLFGRDNVESCKKEDRAKM